MFRNVANIVAWVIGKHEQSVLRTVCCVVSYAPVVSAATNMAHAEHTSIYTRDPNGKLFA